MSDFHRWKKWAAAIAIACSAPPSFCADAALERIKLTSELHIGFREGAAVPFSYILPGQQKPVGFAIDICNSVAEELRKELKLPLLRVSYVPVNTKARFTATADGSIDMECANTTVTVDRRNKGFSFSIPYFITGSKVMVRSTTAASQVYDLSGHTVLVGEGTTTASMLKARDNAIGMGLKLQYFKTRAEAFPLLEQGQADAMVEDETVLMSLRAGSKHPENYKLIGKYLAVEPFAIMFKNDSTELKAVADRVMRRLMRSGELAVLHAQWFESPIPPKNLSLDIPLSNLMKDMIKYPNDGVNAFP